jgi:hypothetical protein
LILKKYLRTKAKTVTGDMHMKLDMFGSVVVVIFQSAFHSEKYQNNIFFYFFKIIFDISV